LTSRPPTILLADARFAPYVLNSDFSVQVQGYVSPTFGLPVSQWPVTSVTPYQKHYGIDPGEFRAYLQPGASGAIFVAWLDEQPVGHVVVSAHWNNYAHVDELAVDASARRRGVARALLDVARFWALKRNLPGIMLETQNNNRGACLLYEDYGFQLGGIDNLRYRAIDATSRETAIFWYLLFAGSEQ